MPPKRKTTKRKTKKRHGGADTAAKPAPSTLSKLNQLAKDTQIISKALDTFGYGGVGSVIGRAGYGRRKKRRGGMLPGYLYI